MLDKGKVNKMNNRTLKILQLAKCSKKNDDSEILRNLKIPNYEYKGLNRKEIDILLSNFSNLFDEIPLHKSPGRSTLEALQCQNVSTTKLDTNYNMRLREVRRNLHFEKFDNVHVKEDINAVSSSINDLEDPFEDSGEEYIPNWDEVSCSDEELDSSNANNELDSSVDNRAKIKILDVHIIKPSRSAKNYKEVKEDGRIVRMPKNLIVEPLNSVEKTKKKIESNTERTKTETEKEVEDTVEEKSENFKEKRNTAKKRSWNKRDFCFYCYNEVLKFSRHVIRHHNSEIEVQEILACSTGDKKRKFLFNKLRNKGNFLKSTTEENVIPIKKPRFMNASEITSKSHLPCKFCLGMYQKDYLARHMKSCFWGTDEKSTGQRRNAQSEGQSLFSSYKDNDILKKEIFPRMKADQASFAAKTDTLICAVAQRYLKSHPEKSFHVVASRKMRQLGSLLVQLKEKLNIKTLLEALNTTNFDIIVKCTQLITRYDEETKLYGAPTLAMNMGTQLKECCDVAIKIYGKKFKTKTTEIEELQLLKEMITNEWRYEVATIANKNLKQKKWNKPSAIPLADDLTLLKTYLIAENEKLKNMLTANPQNDKAFKSLQEVCYVQLLLLNRRRVGELQKMTVSSYTDNINKETTNEFDNCISESEKLLMKSFKKVVIRGKRDRGVPVLFTEEMVKTVNLLLEVRKNFVKLENNFLFANTKVVSSICGSRTIYKHVRLAGVKNPNAITSTKLRKHLATMSQVINLSKQDLEQLANFMGHTSGVHKNYYRLPDDVYQMAKVSKLLVLNERGEASKYKGKSLDDIEINLDMIENSDNESEPEDEFSQATKNNITENQQSATKKKSRNVRKRRTAVLEDMTNNERNISKKSNCVQKKKSRVLERWTEDQKKITLKFFEKHLKNKTAPKKEECIELKNKNPELMNKTWQKIKIFIVNSYQNNKNK